jgi:hypothetical protein
MIKPQPTEIPAEPFLVRVNNVPDHLKKPDISEWTLDEFE